MELSPLPRPRCILRYCRYALMDAHGDYAGVYCCFMVLLGSCLFLQLFVGVISNAFVSIEKKRKKENDILTGIQKDGFANVAEKSENEIAERVAAKKLKRERMSKGEDEIDNEALLPPDIPRSEERLSRRRSSLVIIQEAVESLRLYDRLRALVESDCFAASMLSAVVFNVVVMCLPYQGMPERYASALEATSSALTWLFIWEMVLKLAGLGCQRYWSDPSNVLDGWLVIASGVEMVSDISSKLSSTPDSHDRTPTPSLCFRVPSDPRIITANGRRRRLNLTNVAACPRLTRSSAHESVEEDKQSARRLLKCYSPSCCPLPPHARRDVHLRNFGHAGAASS